MSLLRLLLLLLPPPPPSSSHYLSPSPVLLVHPSSPSLAPIAAAGREGVASSAPPAAGGAGVSSVGAGAAWAGRLEVTGDHDGILLFVMRCFHLSPPPPPPPPPYMAESQPCLASASGEPSGPD